ncbi:MAG: hypothetical protein FJZ96_08075 [Chloroflexi bacterium]|nr:hypothetical protein [Chloroflexota bacterium]
MPHDANEGRIDMRPSTKDKKPERASERLARLEERLGGILQPVRPRREFINGVRQRIQIVQRPSVVNRLNFGQFIVVVLAGVISASFLMVMGTRLLLAAMAVLGLIKPAQRKPVRASS